MRSEICRLERASRSETPMELHWQNAHAAMFKDVSSSLYNESPQAVLSYLESIRIVPELRARSCGTKRRWKRWEKQGKRMELTL